MSGSRRHRQTCKFRRSNRGGKFLHHTFDLNVFFLELCVLRAIFVIRAVARVSFCRPLLSFESLVNFGLANIGLCLRKVCEILALLGLSQNLHQMFQIAVTSDRLVVRNLPAVLDGHKEEPRAPSNPSAARALSTYDGRRTQEISVRTLRRLPLLALGVVAAIEKHFFSYLHFSKRSRTSYRCSCHRLSGKISLVLFPSLEPHLATISDLRSWISMLKVSETLLGQSSWQLRVSAKHQHIRRHA